MSLSLTAEALNWLSTSILFSTFSKSCFMRVDSLQEQFSAQIQQHVCAGFNEVTVSEFSLNGVNK